MLMTMIILEITGLLPMLNEMLQHILMVLLLSKSQNYSKDLKTLVKLLQVFPEHQYMTQQHVDSFTKYQLLFC